METVSAFVKTANQALKAAEKDDAAKRNFLLGLGVGTAMSQDRNHKYVDWFIFAPDAFSVRRINQVAFPGGTVEENDSTRTETTPREADEEIGLRADDVAVLGCLSPYSTFTG